MILDESLIDATEPGSGSVGAELYPHKGFSQGTIKANVIVPKV